MYFDELAIENFGLYRGSHKLNLRPVVKENGSVRPVILLGGMNGGGKTTILDAILLALYGKRAECSKRGAQPYEAFLKKSINYAAGPDAWASVGLTFRWFHDGTEDLYMIRRAWQNCASKIKETVEVFRNGIADHYMAKRWPQMVEEMIPANLSKLFFFDAEQIRQLADDTAALQSLGGAIHSLLGLDLVEALVKDCEILIRKQGRGILSTHNEEELEKLEQQSASLEAQLTEKKTTLAAEQNLYLRAKNSLQLAEQKFASGGGEAHRNRAELMNNRTELKARENLYREHLRDLAASLLPFALVPDLLANAHAEHTKSVTARNNMLFAEKLRKRDREMLAVLQAQKIEKNAFAKIQNWLNKDYRILKQDKTEEITAAILSEKAAATLNELTTGGIARLNEESKKIISELNSVVSELEDIDRVLTEKPDEAHIEMLINEMNAASQLFATKKTIVDQLTSEIEQLSNSLQHMNQRISQLIQQRLEHEHRYSDALVITKLSMRTMENMKKFLRQSTNRKMDTLSRAITDVFRHLLRKRTLVHRVIIDPKIFSIELSGQDGKTFLKERLSEGEKQLFAIAILWGLAKASGRPLPTIIDTPMARLDSEHRDRLVTNYFPKASHQIILLSTDTEINRGYYEKMKPYIARSYLLEYHDKEKFTTVREGYFWE